MIYSLCFCNSVFVCLFSARYALAGRFCCFHVFFVHLLGCFFFLIFSFSLLSSFLLAALSLALAQPARLVRSRCAANDSRSLSCSWLSYACSPSFPLSCLHSLVRSRSTARSHVFVVAATVVIAHTIALSGLGPGANFIQQFNSIIGSGYGYLFYTFLLIISVILAGNMASVFCHMFALYFFCCFFLSFLLCSRLYICVPVSVFVWNCNVNINI